MGTYGTVVTSAPALADGAIIAHLVPSAIAGARLVAVRAGVVTTDGSAPSARQVQIEVCRASARGTQTSSLVPAKLHPGAPDSRVTGVDTAWSTPPSVERPLAKIAFHTRDRRDTRLPNGPAALPGSGGLMVRYVGPALPANHQVALTLVHEESSGLFSAPAGGPPDFQALLNAGGRVAFPAGDWTIDYELFVNQSTTRVDLTNVTMRLADSPLSKWMFHINNKHDIEFVNGSIYGVRPVNPTRGNFGIIAYEVTRFRAIGCSFYDMAGQTIEGYGEGDGIYIGYNSPGSFDCTVDGCLFKDCIRQGVSVTFADRVAILRSRFISMLGNDPGFGIDFEPNGTPTKVINTWVECCFFWDCNYAVGYSGYYPPSEAQWYGGQQGGRLRNNAWGALRKELGRTTDLYVNGAQPDVNTGNITTTDPNWTHSCSTPPSGDTYPALPVIP